jgi:pimeloyl-ACP methyl ester carboxylesterase
MASGTIIFIHGNSSSSKVFGAILRDDSIIQTKIAIDLPGHGENNNGYIDDDFSVPSICNYLIEKINLIDDDILLVGNSLGGHFAIEIAPEIKRLKGLVIHGTPPLKKPINMDEGYVSIPEFSTFLTENPSDKDIRAIMDIIIHKEDVRDVLINEFKKADNRVRTALVKDITANNFTDEFVIFTNLKTPRYIIIGEHDVSVNTDYLLYVKDNCKGKCESFTLKNCGHYHSIEKPKEFAAIIKKIADDIF